MQRLPKLISLRLGGGVEPYNDTIYTSPPIDKKFEVSISKKHHTEENLAICKRLIQSRHSHHLQIQYALEEHDQSLLIVQEKSSTTLPEFFLIHTSQFSVGDSKNVLYGTSVWRQEFSPLPTKNWLLWLRKILGSVILSFSWTIINYNQTPPKRIVFEDGGGAQIELVSCTLSSFPQWCFFEMDTSNFLSIGGLLYMVPLQGSTPPPKCKEMGFGNPYIINNFKRRV